MLRLLGGGYLSVFMMIFGDSLKLNIFEGLFVEDIGIGGVKKQSELENIKSRRSLKLNRFQCLKRRRLNKLQTRIDDSIDVV